MPGPVSPNLGSIITGKKYKTFDEKFKFGKDLFNYLYSNLTGGEASKGYHDQPEEWRNPKHPDFQPSITADRQPEILRGEIPTIKKVAEGISKYAGSVNLSKQSISNAAKRIELDLYNQHGIKTTISHEEMMGKAEKVIDRFQKDPIYYSKRLEAIKSGGTPTIEEELAHRVINAAEFDEFVNSAKLAGEGKIPKSIFNAQQDYLNERYLKVAQPLASSAGRRLNMYNMEVGKNRAFNAIGNLGKKLNDRQIRDLGRVDWSDSKSVNDFVRNLPDPKLMDYVYEFWYNSILSGVPTHVVNVTSNTLWRTFQYPHKGVTAGVDAVLSALSGKKRDFFFREILPSMAGALKAKPKAAKSAWDVIRHGRITQFETKWQKEMGSRYGAFERSGNKFVRGIGHFITPPTKALRAMDVWANSIAFDSQLGALATRTALKKGLKGAARKDFEKGFLKSPPDWAQDEALKYAKYTTFTDDPGKFSEWIMKGRDIIPGGRFVVPFVNTIGNLMKRGVEMTPGVGLVLAKGQKPAEVIAKQIEGSLLSLYMLHKADKGEITGATPQSEAKKEAFYSQGKQPWALKIGDNWLSYRRIEPFNTTLASTAIAYDAIKNAKSEDEATVIFARMAQEYKNNLLDSSYLQGMSQFLDRYGSVAQLPKKLASSLVPYSSFWRSINRSYEAYETGSAKVYENKDWLDAFAQVIPGLYKLREPRLNVWGEEIELQGGVFRQWLPYRWSTATSDPTELFLEKLDTYPGTPENVFTRKGIKSKFSDDIYRQYTVDYGVKAKKWLDRQVNTNSSWHRLLESEAGREKLKSRIQGRLESIRGRAQRKAIREQLKEQ